MSTIKKASTPKAQPARTAPTKKPSDAKRSEEAKKPQDPKKADDAGKIAEADKSKEAARGKEADKTEDVAKPEGAEAAEDAAKPGEEAAPTDEFEESEELKAEKEDENAEMREELQGLKDALASLYDLMGSEDEKKEEVAESPGGCCGKPSGAKQAGDGQGSQDWNQILTVGIAAVKAQGLGGGGNLTLLQGGQGGAQSGAAQGVQGAAASGAAKGQGAKAQGADAQGARPGAPTAGGTPTDPRTKLASDYEKAKAAKAELKPEVESEVRSLLGMPPLEDEKGAAGPTAAAA